MKENKIKFSVIGCGNIGSRHISTIRSELQAELVAICDIDEEKCKYLSKQYGGIPYFKDYKKMLREIKVDVVNICTPNNLHAEMAMQAAKMKVNILVEKPMSLTKAEALKMIREANKNRVKLMVVKQNRFNAPVLLTQKVISENHIGKILMINSSILWNRNDEYYLKSDWHGIKKLEGGALYTQASHFIDLLILWCGDITNAKTLMGTKNHSIETEDCGVSALQFKNGAIGAIEWTTCVYNKNYEGSITIIGEKGTIKIGGQYLNKIEFWDVPSYPTPENDLLEEHKIYDRHKNTTSNHNQVISNVISHVLGNKCDIVTGEDGMKTIEAIEKIYKGTREDR